MLELVILENVNEVVMNLKKIFINEKELHIYFL